MKVCLQNANLRVDGESLYLNHLYIPDNFVGGCLYVNLAAYKQVLRVNYVTVAKELTIF